MKDHKTVTFEVWNQSRFLQPCRKALKKNFSRKRLDPEEVAKLGYRISFN